MAIWIKICGMTTLVAINKAIELKVDALGFVFAPSKRQVTAAQARELAAAAPTHIARVAVMLHPDQALVDQVLEVFKPDALQTDWQDLHGLHLPSELLVLPVLRAGQPLPSIMPTRVVFEGPVSGTGTTADWQQAAQYATQGQMVLAGGLNPANVAAAIRAVRPWGVDVSSGVESTPGMKDPHKMNEFVQAARAAQ